MSGSAISHPAVAKKVSDNEDDENLLSIWSDFAANVRLFIIQLVRQQ